jgi:hypothetical protein
MDLPTTRPMTWGFIHVPPVDLDNPAPDYDRATAYVAPTKDQREFIAKTALTFALEQFVTCPTEENRAAVVAAMTEFSHVWVKVRV